MREQFGSFTASELYCPKCQSAQPVREKLLLVLPSGELHEYLCSRCGTSVGQRTASGLAVAAPPTPPAPWKSHAPGRSGARGLPHPEAVRRKQ